jgi:hypothetical protein
MGISDRKKENPGGSEEGMVRATRRYDNLRAAGRREFWWSS